jgi:hypothetical protein
LNAGTFTMPFSTGGIITGLAPTTAYWFDIALNAQAVGLSARNAPDLSALRAVAKPLRGKYLQQQPTGSQP